MAEVVLSPFSNSAMRDWPYYGALIGLFVEQTDHHLSLVGTASQSPALNDLVRLYPATRVANTAGVLPWPRVVELVRSAALVIANNSGLAHLAGELDVPTVC